MGCPGATIVFEELIQLGVKRSCASAPAADFSLTTRSAT